MICEFSIKTSARNQLLEITAQVQEYISKSQMREGICVVFTPHTTAAVTINENADPDVKTDVLRKLADVFPQSDNYRHNEGNSDSHIKSSLVGCAETIIVSGGRLLLGTWQGIYFCEFDGPRQRKFCVKLVGG
ncbi:MAG: secondary thiamine-phosphate synthase enzyme YjbQ [Candidatus Zixiibacteriota bacterium]